MVDRRRPLSRSEAEAEDRNSGPHFRRKMTLYVHRLKLPVRRAAGIAIAAGMMLFPKVGWAGADFCTSTAQTLASFGTTSTSNGCFNADESFINFNTITVAGGPPQSNATNQIAATNTFSSVSTPWTVTDLFTPVAASDWEASGSSGNLVGATMLLTDSGNNFAPNPFYPTPDPGDGLYLDSLKVIATGMTGNGAGGGDNMSLSAAFCAGTAPCNGNNTVQLNVDWGNNTSTVAAYTCSVDAGAAALFSCGSSLSSNPITVTFLQPVQTVNLDEFYDLSTTGGTDELFSFANDWGNEELPTGASPAPEPSTFLSIGLGIAAVGFLRARRKKPGDLPVPRD
jgi:PEP-CTERM motif